MCVGVEQKLRERDSCPFDYNIIDRMLGTEEEQYPSRHSERSRMSVRNITEMNIKNRKSRDQRFHSTTLQKPLLDTQTAFRSKPNFCLEITKRPSSSYITPVLYKPSSESSILVSGFKPKLKPKLLQDNPFILGNIIRKKLKVLAGGDIDKYLSSMATDAIKKRKVRPRMHLLFEDVHL